MVPALAMERTHRLRADLTWMPKRALRSSRLIRGVAWTAIGGAVVGSMAIAPVMAVMWKGLLVGGAGAAAIVDRAARAAMKKQVAKMTRGELPLAELDTREEGELVVVRGTIEPGPEPFEPLRGLLTEASGVYRRLVFQSRGTWVHEAAVDFTLVDEHGGRILVEAAGARWMTPTRELVTYPATRFADMPTKIRELTAGKESIEAIERVLAIGTQVQLVGYKTTSADATGTARDYRSAPQRATLQSGAALPLVITNVDG